MEMLDLTHEVIRAARAREPEPAFAPRILKEPERLPFTVRIAVTPDDLERAVDVRRQAYGRHLPEFGRSLSVEPIDSAPGTTVLIAESRLDGAPLGTLRIQTNEFAALPVEQSVRLPAWCASGKLAEATRLAVKGPSSGRMVKMMLFKALFLLCEQQEIDWLIITARSPLDREYEAMLFRDIFEDRRYEPMAHVGGLPHRVMAGEVSAARTRWAQAHHPLYGFVFETVHPELDLTHPAAFDAALAMANASSMGAAQLG